MTRMWITLDSPVAEVGGTITGRVEWEGAEKDPRAVEVALSYRCSGSGEADTGRPSTSRAAADRSGSYPFELAVPDDGPITFEGRLISVAWKVSAKLDLALADDPGVAEDVVVFPRGGRTLWVRRTAPPPAPDGS